MISCITSAVITAIQVCLIITAIFPVIPVVYAYKEYQKNVKPPKDDVERAARMQLGYPEFIGPFMVYCLFQYGIVFAVLATLGFFSGPDFYKPPRASDMNPPSASTSSLETPADRDD